MAGDWTPLRDNIHDDPDVYAIAAALNVKDSDLVVGKLTRFWAWASQHTEDGRLVGVTREMVDRIAKQRRFAEVLIGVRWLEEHGQVLVIPRFDRWMSRSAKARLSETKARQLRRAKGGKRPDLEADSSGQCPDNEARLSGPNPDYRTGQDRTEEKDPDSLSPGTSSGGVRSQATEPAEAAPVVTQPTAAGRFVADRAVRTGEAPPGFARFLAEYPQGRAKDRGGLLTLWRSLGLEDAADGVLAGLRAWNASDDFRDGYAPEAKKFLNERHWETLPPPRKPKPQALGGAW